VVGLGATVGVAVWSVYQGEVGVREARQWGEAGALGVLVVPSAATVVPIAHIERVCLSPCVVPVRQDAIPT
jgi:hypothetical protein